MRTSVLATLVMCLLLGFFAVFGANHYVALGGGNQAPRTTREGKGIGSEVGGSLHKAAEKGLVDEVKRLLDDEVSPNWGKKTPLHYAAAEGRQEVVELLIARGADLDAKDNVGRTPLGMAALEGKRDVAELLITKGAAVTLHVHAALGDLGQVEQALAKGEPVDLRDDHGRTALHDAGSAAVVELLISKGADVKASNEGGMTPLHYAAARGQSEVAELLLEKGADVDALDNWETTPLFRAARGGHESTARLLVDRGAKVDLHIAAMLGDTDRLKALIAAGQDVDALSSFGGTPLYFASLRGQKEAVEFLLDRGAAIDAEDTFGSTPLHAAAQAGHAEVVELLLTRSAQVNAQDTSRQPALYLAASEGHTRVVELLLDRRAAPMSRHIYSGMAPLDVALRNYETETAELLRSRGARASTHRGAASLVQAVQDGRLKEVRRIVTERPEWVNAPSVGGCAAIHYAPHGSHLAILEFLVEHGADVNQETSSGETPLSIALFYGQKRTVDWLITHGATVGLQSAAFRGDVEAVAAALEQGVDVNGWLGRGRKMLHNAVCLGHLELVKLLIERGADVDANSVIFGRPLHYAASKGHREVVKVLIEAGADVNAPNVRGKTPLDWSLARGHADVTALLRQHAAGRGSVQRPVPRLKMPVRSSRSGPGGKRGKRGPSLPEICLAAQKGDVEKVRELLAADSNSLNEKGAYGRSALHYAASSGNADVVKLLLDKGVEVDVTSYNRLTPLHMATRPEAAELLLDRGADVGAVASTGATPLHIAAERCWPDESPETVALLIERGADVAARDSAGRTPMHYARSAEVIELFLSKGASATAKDNRGASPLHRLAQSVPVLEPRAMLQRRKGRPGDASREHRAALEERVRRAVDVLLAHGATIDEQNSLGETPLHLAVLGGTSEVVAALLSHKANPDATDKYGRTPLDCVPLRKVMEKVRPRSKSAIRTTPPPPPRVPSSPGSRSSGPRRSSD